jgi:hypothetical protein
LSAVCLSCRGTGKLADHQKIIAIFRGRPKRVLIRQHL